MAKWTAAVIAALTVWTGAWGAEVTGNLGTATVTAEVTMSPQEQVDFICNVLNIDEATCDEVEYPNVEFVYTQQSVAGYYDGTDTIYLSTAWVESTSALQVEEVLIHELTHYVDVTYLDMHITAASSCELEARAWHIGNTFYVLNGKPEAATYGWYEWYDCPAPGPVT